MTGPLPEGWYERAGLEAGFTPDTAVFDVDGVLVDVRSSFREVIRRTATVVQRLMGVTSPWTPTHADLTAFKRAGGFNDDVDMSIAMAAIGAGGRGGEVAAIARGVEAAGGGLRALRTVAPDLPRVTGALVLRVFDEHYWGTEAYRRRTGTPAEHLPPGTAGLIDTERALVDADLPGRLRAAGVRCVALITGRTPTELEAALERIGWGASDLDAVVTGDVIRKPDPGCIDLVTHACRTRAAVYVGDVRDDWEMVRRHRAERPDGPALRGVLVGDDTEMEVYRPLGVDATLRSTRDLPALLARWRES